MNKRYYLGMATTIHDPAVAIVDDAGEVLFAEGAERRYQVKRANGCPPDNIAWTENLLKEYCLPGANYIVTKSWSKKSERRMVLFYSSGVLRLRSILNKQLRKTVSDLTARLSINSNNAIFSSDIGWPITMNSGASLKNCIARQIDAHIIKTTEYDHHLSHAGLACYGSPFNDAICLVTDGSGEEGSISIYIFKNGKISLLEKQKGSVSLAGYYARLTRFCGFDSIMGEEWKVMGLAAYGSLNKQIYDLFRSIYYVDDCKIKFVKNDAETKVFQKIQDLTLADRANFSLKADLAYNGQLAYSQWMNELISNIHKKYPSDNLIFTGGCALNSSHNGEILAKTPFKKLYIPSAPGDDGNALGGALLAYYADNTHAESIHKNISPYLGTEITNEQIKHFLQFSGCGKVRHLVSDKYATVAHLIAEGKIIGWVQGKAEFGPRALGNRSILADPRKKDIKDIINERVKFREEFRPFAPSILHEYGPEYFEHYQESHYMERTLTFKKEAREKVPGVVHVNNTGRLQTVKEEWNSELYHLIRAFHNITNVPVLLNTSFNVMGKPIIHSVEDALSTFFTTGIDALVVNDYLIEK